MIVSRRDLCRAAAASFVLFQLPSALAQTTTTTIPIGTRVFAIPAAFLSSYDNASATLAAVWPDMTGAMELKNVSVPPRDVLTITWLLRPPLSRISEAGRRLAWEPWPKDGTDTMFGLRRMMARRRDPGHVLLVDDPSSPTLLVRYPETTADPADMWQRLEFDVDEIRGSVLLYGTLLPHWTNIRAEVTKLLASFQTR